MILGPTNPNELQVKPHGVRNLGQPSPQSQPAVLTENSHQLPQTDFQCNTADGCISTVPGQEHSNPQVDPSALPNHNEPDTASNDDTLLKEPYVNQEDQNSNNVRSDIANYITAEDQQQLHNATIYPLASQASSISSPNGHRSQKIYAVVEGHKLPILLDTGAEVSVVPKSFMSQVVATPTTQCRTVTSFGGAQLLLEGPRYLQVEICGINIVHPFYALDSNTPVVAGFDLIVAAQLIIDTKHGCTYSNYSCPMPMPHLASTRPNVVEVTPDPQSSSTFSLTDTSGTPQCQGPSAPCSLSSGVPLVYTHSTDAPMHPQSVITNHDCTDHVAPLSGATGSQSQSDTEASDLPAHVRLLFESTVKDSNLSASAVTGLHDLLNKHADTFAKSSADLGFCSILQHDIDTGDHYPIKQPPRRPPLAARDEEDKILQEMLQTGVIEPSMSPWASPVCLVRKKDGNFRFCVDYRRVNAISKKYAFPVPNINDALDSLRGNRYFATADLLSGYWQLGLTERAKERSAFCTKRGLFQFTKMPFGLAGAPTSFCRLMSIVFADLLWVICVCYIDDLIIFGRTEQELLDRLDVVFSRLREVGLKLKANKSVLFRQEVEFLGHLVTAEGIQPLPQKLEVIRDWPTPHCIRDVRAFYGLASYYRKFVRDFATIAEPLTRLTRKNAIFQWTEEAERAFQKLKAALMAASTLAFPRPDLPCILDTDASDVAAGGVISQLIDGQEHPIAFFSRVLNEAQRNYCPTRRELLAVVASLQHFRHYLLGTKIILRTDHHSLKWLNNFKRPEGILARWIETLAEFDFEIEHRPGRVHCNADGVSRPLCKQCWGKAAKLPWIDELERADELTEPLSVHALELQPEFTDSEMTDLQHSDPTLGPVIDCLTQGANPSLDELKCLPLDSRNLWAQRPAITLQSGVLVRKKEGVTQLVVPISLRRRLFDHVHAGPLAAHLGSERTLKQLQQSYYWTGMRSDVSDLYRRCEQCALSKGPLNHPQGKLEKVITGAPMDIVAIDILSGLPTAADGSKYLLVITDYFTKWAEAYALPDAEASTCMKAMYEGFFSRFGLPRQLHSDMAKNFESKLFAEICRLTGIHKTRTTPFHPRSDGQTERMNRTILKMLRASASDNPFNWPTKIHTTLAAYRMTVHSTTGVTPNKAMLGREVLLPAHLIAKPPDEPVRLTVPFVETFQVNMREAHERVRRATQASAKIQKTHFDKLVRGPPFAVDQLVWLYWPRPPLRMKFKKLQQIWSGPWRILSFKTQVVVVIQHIHTLKKQTVHLDRLSPCLSVPHSPSTQSSTHTTPAVVDDDPPGTDIFEDPQSQHFEDQSTAQDSDRQQSSQERLQGPIVQSVPTPGRSGRSRRRPRYLVDFV